MKRKSLLLLMSSLILCSTLTAVADGQAPTADSSKQWPVLKSAIAKDPAIEKRVEELLARMTLEEKVGQVIQPEINEITPEDVKKYHIGSVLNGGGGTPGRNKHASVD